MRRAEVWVADLGEDIGHKPVLVISEDGINIGLHQPIVARVTAQERERSIRTAVTVEPSVFNGLDEDSWVLCHDLTTLREKDFSHKVGELTQLEMERVAQGLRLALRLDNPLGSD